MEAHPVQLTILMPCLDEGRTIARCVRKAKASLDSLGMSGEIVVADNGSRDGSREIARSEGARVVNVPQRGYGSALRAGIEAARGQWVIIGDADDSYDFSSLRPFVDRLHAGDQLVMGCRFPRWGGTIARGAMPWKHRWIGNPILSFLGRLFFHPAVHDFHCGLRGFDRVAIQSLELQTTGMEFASEMVIRASLAGLRISEVPILLQPDGRTKAPHLRSWRDGWRHLRFMLLFSPRWLFLVPGATLVLLGAAGGLRLWIGPVTVGRFGLDTNTLLLCSMAVVVGFQICLFAVFTRIFAIRERLLPEPPRYARLFQIFTLERGLLAAILLMLAGVMFLVRAVLVWGKAGFGGLSYPDSLRLVIPSVTFLTLGVQMLFSSFFLSILGIRSGRSLDPPEERAAARQS